MVMKQPFHTPQNAAGFSLIELLVGVAIGLLSTVVIATVLAKSENQKRTLTSGADAQISGGVAVYELERAIKMAGYGIALDSPALGCPLQIQLGGKAVVGAPTVLAPVLITAGALPPATVGGVTAANSDSIRVLSSNTSAGFSVNAEVIAPYYNPSSTGTQRTTFALPSSVGFSVNDLAAAFYPAPNFVCQVFQVSGVNSTPPNLGVTRVDSATWNAPGFPNLAAAAPVPPGLPAMLINLGNLSDNTFQLSSNFRLRMTSFNLAQQATAATAATAADLRSNIVAFRAFYGKDTDGDGAVDTYDQVTPTTNAGWQQVMSVRIALLARSTQFEHEEVTPANPVWDVGATTTATVTGSTACGSSQCITLRADVSSDWKHYRYKMFSQIIPLRNMQWHSS